MSVFNDVVASPERRSWMYKISAVNDCGIESRLSKHHKTIHLVMTDGPSPNSKKLTWDHYEGLEYFYYDLYRKTDVDGWQLIQDSIEIITLPDFIDTLPTGATHVDYIVEVVPVEGGCTADYGRAQDYNSSRSNKPSPIFEPSGEEEEEDPSSGLVSYENEGFKAVVYPNPSNGTFNIDILENTNNQALEMLVVGVNGNIIHKQALDNDLNTVHLNVDSGIYFIKILSETSLETIRVVVQ
ncbi:MAG TPA: T9SS type A sorting domain-containing protein [Brumimicrobium sp.]|nr:T9SS type A sorting domain-containing protein [Brumimicrobium sp.]